MVTRGTWCFRCDPHSIPTSNLPGNPNLVPSAPAAAAPTAAAALRIGVPFLLA
jgi:hypothetical protein